jgi:catechol 2,3-dioxygenase-like lactoylglutathione lyase family enzyme
MLTIFSGNNKQVYMTKEFSFKFDKVSIRVADLKKSIEFYSNGLGMDVFSSELNKDGSMKKCIVGYKGDDDVTCIELNSVVGSEPIILGEVIEIFIF